MSSLLNSPIRGDGKTKTGWLFFLFEDRTTNMKHVGGSLWGERPTNDGIKTRAWALLIC